MHSININIAQYNYKEKLAILKETRVVTYTYRYSSGNLIPNSSWHDWIIRIKCPLEYLQV